MLIGQYRLARTGRYKGVYYYKDLKTKKYVLYYPEWYYDEDHQYICDSRKEIYAVIDKLLRKRIKL